MLIWGNDCDLSDASRKRRGRQWLTAIGCDSCIKRDFSFVTHHRPAFYFLGQQLKWVLCSMLTFVSFLLRTHVLLHQSIYDLSLGQFELLKLSFFSRWFVWYYSNQSGILVILGRVSIFYSTAPPDHPPLVLCCSCLMFFLLLCLLYFKDKVSDI